MKYPRKYGKLRKVKLFEVKNEEAYAEVIAMHDTVYLVYKKNWYKMGDRDFCMEDGFPFLNRMAKVMLKQVVENEKSGCR